MQGNQAAIGNINTILWTNKTNYVKKARRVKGSGKESDDEYRVIVFHGATGNGKSMIALLKFISRVFNAPREHQNFVLAGRDITALERRFIESNHSVFNWFPFRGKWEYRKRDIGGSRITIKARTGEKYIYLTPFNNVSTYSRILGDTIHGVMVDEAVEGDEQFLEEIISRATVRTEGSWAIFTSNGGDPNHYFYTGIVNKCITVDEMIDDVLPTPEGEKKYFDKDRNKDWLYVHMRLEDNPAYTKEQLDRFYSLYPVGSFMYYSRVLGIRGFSQDSPFAPFINENIMLKRKDLVEKGWYPQSMVFSIDSGGHVFSMKDYVSHSDEYGDWHSEYQDGDYGTKSGGHTVMVTVGFLDNYNKAIILDAYFPNHMHQNINVDRMYDRVYNISKDFPRVRKPYMFVDPADPSVLSLARDKRGAGVNEVRPAIKRDNSIALDEKVVISLIQQYLMNGNLMILDTKANRKWLVNSMIQATLESDGKLVDNRSWEADIQDSLKYVFSSMYRLLVR